MRTLERDDELSLVHKGKCTILNKITELLSFKHKLSLLSTFWYKQITHMFFCMKVNLMIYPT